MSQEFAIDSVVSMDLPNEVKWSQRNGQFYVNCPFCGGVHKMNINTDKNLWRCAKCGEGGNVIQLHSRLTGLSNSDAYRDLVKALGRGDVVLEMKENSEIEQRIHPVDIVQRKFAYTQLIEQLTLKNTHRQNLRKRGLTDADIQRLQYKSYPRYDLEKIAKKALYGVKLGPYEGIPGFYDTETDEPHLVTHRDGFLIPVMNEVEIISGFQIRASETVEGMPRYTWLSSGKMSTGCSVTGCENIHHAGNWRKCYFGEMPKVIGLTEGALKADVAATIFDRLQPGKDHLFLGLTGVSNTGQLEERLAYYGKRSVEEVHVYVDMDYRDKPEVAKALKKIIGIIEKTTVVTYVPKNDGTDYVDERYKKMICRVMVWGQRKEGKIQFPYKGIDDFLAAYEKDKREGKNNGLFLSFSKEEKQ